MALYNKYALYLLWVGVNKGKVNFDINSYVCISLIGNYGSLTNLIKRMYI